MRIEMPLAGIASGLLALLAATLWLLWPGIHGPFLFDDIPNFENLAHLDGRLDRTSVGVYLSLFGGLPGRPVAALSFLLNDVAWPSDALGFKLTNLWLHVLNGVLVFGLARSLGRAMGWQRNEWVALLAAAIWLLNPIQVSAIFLTVQRMTLLSALFAFAGLWAYVAVVQRCRQSWHALLAVAGLGAGTVLAWLSKENGALVPLLALVLNATLLRGALARLTSRQQLILWAGPTLAVLALAVGLALQWDSIADFTIREFSMGERLLTQPRVLMTYIGLMALPRLSSSALYNDDYVFSQGLLQPLGTLPALMLVLLALAAALWFRRRWPLLSFAVLWYLAGHALESTALSLELYFEHRNYLPLLGPAFALASLARDTGSQPRRLLLAGLLAWLALSALIVNLQARVWGNWEVLSTTWQAENSGSLRAQQQYADFLYRTGQPVQARQVFVDATARGVAPLDGRLQVAVIDCWLQRPVDPAEMTWISEQLRTATLTIGTAATLASVRESAQSGECPDVFPAQTWLEMTRHALGNPTAAGLQRMLRMERAEFFLDRGLLDEANRELNAAWRSGYEPRIAFFAAAVLASNQRFDQAREWAQRPLVHRPSPWKAWLAQTDRQAHALIAAIDQAQQEQHEQNEQNEQNAAPRAGGQEAE